MRRTDLKNCSAAMREVAHAIDSAIAGKTELAPADDDIIKGALLQLARELVQKLMFDPRIGSEARATFQHEMRFLSDVAESRGERQRLS